MSWPYYLPLCQKKEVPKESTINSDDNTLTYANSSIFSHVCNFVFRSKKEYHESVIVIPW